MFNWLFKKKDESVQEDTKRGFSAVKKDMELVGKWIKHLEAQDKQLLDELSLVKQEMSSVKDEIEGLREAVHEVMANSENKQVFEKTGVLSKQTAVYDVEEAVQTPVQTGNIYDILKNLTANERLLIFTLMNSEMKLSYEDLALLIGKEKSTVRGQINAIKQKSEGIIMEITEKNGKKRVYVPDEIKEKLAKYGKTRVAKKKKAENQ